MELDGEPVTEPGRDRTVMFQESALFPWLDVLGNVMFGLKLVPGLTRGDRLAMAEKNLELVGLKRQQSDTFFIEISKENVPQGTA